MIHRPITASSNKRTTWSESLLLGGGQLGGLLGLDDLGELLVALYAVLLAPPRHRLADPLPPLGGLAVKGLQGLLEQFLLIRCPGRGVEALLVRRRLRALRTLRLLRATLQHLLLLTFLQVLIGSLVHLLHQVVHCKAAALQLLCLGDGLLDGPDRHPTVVLVHELGD